MQFILQKLHINLQLQIFHCFFLMSFIKRPQYREKKYFENSQNPYFNCCNQFLLEITLTNLLLLLISIKTRSFFFLNKNVTYIYNYGNRGNLCCLTLVYSDNEVHNLKNVHNHQPFRCKIETISKYHICLYFE